MIEDVPCVRLYQTIREGVGADARRLGVGRNLYPTSPALADHLNTLFGVLLTSQRFSTYESEADGRERDLVAELLRQYLKHPGITADDVFFINGAQEGISIVQGYGARRGLAALLPLPLYYAFEQSSRRWGMPVVGHYRGDGTVWWHRRPSTRLLQVQIVPNGVTGTLFSPPSLTGGPTGRQVDFSLIDCIFQLGAFGEGGLAEPTRAIVHGTDLGRSALLFTLSKDLSLPGLRAGVLVTQDRDLMRYAKSDRFERLYSISPLAGQAVAIYLALLLLCDSPPQPSLEARLAAAFRDTGVRFPSESALHEMLQHFTSMTWRCRNNLALVTQAGPLLLDRAAAPVAGYSAFPRVALDFAREEDFISWIRHAGLCHGLKLNPAYLYGGTPEIWSALYPKEHRIRVNVSDPPDELTLTLLRLVEAVERAPAV